MNRYLTELLGTFVLVLAVVGVTIGAMSDAAAMAAAPLVVGAALGVVVYAGEPVSGGHFNPAVSLAAVIRGRLGLVDLGPYVAAQLTGALLASVAALGLYGDELDAAVTLQLDDSLWQAFAAELVFTFVLAWVAVGPEGTASSVGSRGSRGLAVGAVFAVGVAAVGRISGGAFNPALAFGLTVSGLFAWEWIWLYVVAQVVGGALAAVVAPVLGPARR